MGGLGEEKIRGEKIVNKIKGVRRFTR